MEDTGEEKTEFQSILERIDKEYTVLQPRLTQAELQFEAVKNVIKLVETDLKKRFDFFFSSDYDGYGDFEYIEAVSLKHFHYKSLVIALYSTFESVLLDFCQYLEMLTGNSLNKTNNSDYNYYLNYLRKYGCVKNVDIKGHLSFLDKNKFIRNAICHNNSELYNLDVYFINNKNMYDILGLDIIQYDNDKNRYVVLIQKIDYIEKLINYMFECIEIITKSFPRNESELIFYKQREGSNNNVQEP